MLALEYRRISICSGKPPDSANALGKDVLGRDQAHYGIRLRCHIEEVTGLNQDVLFL